METITQIAKQLTLSFEELLVDPATLPEISPYEFGARMAMIYAQRWIPLTGEQPELNKAILIKDKDGFWDKGVRVFKSGNTQYVASSGSIGEVVTWKPESRKI